MVEKHDPYSYKGFANRHSLMLATGVALMLLGCSLSAFASLLPSPDQADSAVIAKALDELASLATKDVVHTDFASSHVLATILLLSFAIMGAWVLGRAQSDLKDFQKAYPALTVAFTQEEKEQLSRASLALCVAASIALVASVALGAMGHDMMNLAVGLESSSGVSKASALSTGLVLFGAAVGGWLMVRGVTLGRMPDRFRYDFKSIGRVSVYEIDKQTKGDLNSKLRQVRRIVARKSLANRCIIIAGALASLSLYALPSLHTPLFWLGISAAGVACLAVGELSLRHARKLFPDFDAYDFEGRSREAP